jgi:phytoene dehydrogenase-like protein
MVAGVDALVVGAGHNGLVASILLARAGLRVRVLEACDVLGGACRTEYPFPKAPDVGQSTGAYVLGLMPPELMRTLGFTLPLLRRDPHYFLPTTSARYLLFGADRKAAESQIARFFSVRDADADRDLQRELAMLRDDLAPAWLEGPWSVEATAERYVRPALRESFIGLCRGSVGDYLAKFGFESELLSAMYAVTDGFTGLYGSFDTPGSGMNFLVHNMCRLPGSDGTWMVVRGGMGTVTATLADVARREGVEIQLGAQVEELDIDAGVLRGATTSDGEAHRARVVLVNADPFRMLDMLGEACPESLRARVDAYRRPGSSIKVNLCLSDLPRFTCLPERRGQHRATIHLLPEEQPRAVLTKAFQACVEGRLPEVPAIEWFIHTTLDPSLQDSRGRHSSALFCQWVPYELSDGTWSQHEDAFVRRLLSICDQYAPGTSDLVEDVFTLTPPKIEARFGITQGHIHHVDNSFGFADRMPYRVGVPGLYACGAGCHPAGSVIGAAGHNAALEALEDLGLTSSRGS